jgi:hypothetical protein
VDVDCDDRLTGSDSVVILEFFAGLPNGSIPAGCPPLGSADELSSGGGARHRGDLDCNGVIDPRDALVVLRFVSGETSAANCEA